MFCNQIPQPEKQSGKSDLSQFYLTSLLGFSAARLLSQPACHEEDQ